MRTFTSLAVALGLLLAAAPALAVPAKAGVLARLDADGDGRISREEAALAPALAQQFVLIDANRDGWLERAEMQDYARERRELRKAAVLKRFERLDANHDGVLDGPELDARPRLLRRDRNGDGRVELAEFRQPVPGRHRRGCRR